MPLRRLRCGRTLLAALLALAVVTGSMAVDLARPAPAAAAPVWNDGPIAYSTILNCPSVIGGYPYSEYGMGALVGAAVDTAAPAPVINETFQIRVVLAGLGYPCDTQRAFVEIKLPPNVTPAVTAADPIRCYLNAQAVPANQCPQQLGAGSEAGHLSVPAPQAVPFAPAFPFSQGEQIELRIPVKASASMTNASLESRIHVIDGNSNPILRPKSSITVFTGGGGTPATPTVSYPTPSTTGITKTAATSRATIARQGTTGTASFEIGTGGSTSNVASGVSPTLITGSHSGSISTTWPGVTLQPGTTYTWRARYAPSGGSVVYGPTQSFTTLPQTDFVVGTGTRASCTQSALVQTLSAAAAHEGAKVTFDCGPDPHTITLPSRQLFDRSVTIDGGNLITIRATGEHHFTLAGSTSTVQNITLVDGYNPVCGGSIYVFEEFGHPDTHVTLNNVVLRDNEAYSGGAVCVGERADANLIRVLASGNEATHSGGVLMVHSLGTAWVRSGEWSNNRASFGGAAAVAASGTSGEFGYMTLSDNKALRGGAIKGYGNVTLNHVTLSGNEAEQGGAIETVASSVGRKIRVTSSTIAHNRTTDTSSAAIHVDENVTETVGVEVRGTLLVGNTQRSCTADGVETAGGNLSDDTSCNLYWPADQQGVADPKVGPLAHNGGFSRTHALLPGSPAIDRNSNSNCLFNDQRGRYNPVTLPNDSTRRQVDGDGNGSELCDVGSYEYHPDDLPGTPTGVTATPGIGQATVSWTAPVITGEGPITGYRITPYLDGVAQAPVNTTGTGVSRTVTGLQHGGRYTFRVAAKNATGIGADSAASSAITLADVPGTVATPQVSAGTRAATVSWTAPASGGSPITGYVITPYRNGTAQAAITVGSGVRTRTVTGLDAGVPYTFRVRARNAVGNGAWSPHSAVVTPTAPSDPGDPGGPKPPPPPHGFPDVPGNAYFDAAVRWLKAEGITSGVGSTGLFKPNDAVTRAQMATFLWRLMGSPSTSKAHGFPDVPRGAYYDEAVRWLKAAGITGGVGDTGLFKPNDPVTRAQMAAFLHRLVSSPSVGAGHGFADVPSSAYYDMAVRWLKATGITTGVGGTNRFAPNDVVNRAQMAAFLHRLASTPSAWSKVPPSKIPPTVTF